MTDTSALKSLGVLRILADLVPGLQWQRDGSWHKCKCPFHEDTHASFKTGRRAPHRGQCFACGAAGDVVELAARVWGCDAGAAMRRLAELYPEAAEAQPVEVHENKGGSHDEEPEVHLAWSALYRRALAITTLDAGAQYLGARGVLGAALHSTPLVRAVEGSRLAEWSRDVARDDGVTWAAAGGRGLFWKLTQMGASVLLFGTLTTDGQHMAGLHVRLLDPPAEGPRYCQVGPDPRPWRSVTPLGPGDVVICEGAIDALSWETAGVRALALHGVEMWRPWYARALPAGARPVVALDRDDAGRRTQLRVARDLARLGWPVRVVDLQAEGPKDANDALLQGGVEALQAILATARPFEVAEPETRSEGPGASGGPPPAARAPGKMAEGRGGSGGPPPAAPPPRDTPAAPAEAPREEMAGPPLFQGDIDVTRFQHLPDLIEAAHWSENTKGEVVRVALVQPMYKLTDLVIRWVEQVAHGLFLRDSSGAAWLYITGRLLRMDTNDSAWKGWLYQVARIVLTDREGKGIASALEQYALSREHAPEPRPWMWHDRDGGSVALHLHDAGDQVALVEPGQVRLVQNGTGPILMIKDANTRPIRVGRRSAEWALSALEELVVKGLACEPSQRSLIVSWAISALIRQRIDTKATLFLTGAAGAGKTEAARLVTTLWHGAPRVLQTTVAALWVEGERQPIVALDNQESGELEVLKQWLLVAATDGQRIKRLEGTSSGVLTQRADALALVTAIEPPPLDEQIQRFLLVRFRHALHSQDYSSSSVLADLQKARGRIIGGLLELLAHGILPRLDELRTITTLIPSGHPKRRLGQHLALCALIADAAHQVRGSIWGTGRHELAGWLEAQATSAGELARGSDPVLDALQRLLWDWNRIVLERGQSGILVRPAAEEARYRCTPLYRTEDGTWSEVESEGHDRIARNKVTFGTVAGVEGSYADLHADLLRVCRESSAGPAFAKRIGTPAVLSARWSNNQAIAGAGWKAHRVGRSGRDGRIYRFLQEGGEA